MKFALNYSPQAVELLKTGQIEIDNFKCPDWLWMITEASQLRPVAVHFTLTAGDGKIEKTDWSLVEKLLETTGTPFVNLHLESRKKDFPSLPFDTTATVHQEQIYVKMVGDINVVTKRFGAEKVIIENVPYRGKMGKVLRPSVEPGLIHRILEETGCGLLFDLSHARIAAFYLQMKLDDYLDQLPMNRMREMHFTGMKWMEGKLTDHLEAQESDWQALDKGIDRIHRGEWPEPWLIAFEYGGVGEAFAWRSEISIIASQVPKLYQLIHHRS